jgi:large subunit ribosomal protein L19
MTLLEYVEDAQLRYDIPSIRSGQTVRVHTRITEGEKERVQIFQGTVLRKRGSGANASFTVRKISNGVGVEKVFPLHSPRLAKVEVISQGYVRQSRIYFLRDRIGKATKLRRID